MDILVGKLALGKVVFGLLVFFSASLTLSMLVIFMKEEAAVNDSEWYL